MRTSPPTARTVGSAAAVAVALLLSGCGGEDAPPPPVDDVARALATGGADRVIVYVSDGGGEHVATAGAHRPRSTQRFRVGSVTKTFTATIVLQLVEEGRLQLDDTLEDHLPGIVPRGSEITIRELLQHRSGLANVTDYRAWLDQASRSSATTPLGTLRFGASKPLVFGPGSRWAYSNTNYIALGLVIEEVTGRSYREELEKRILEPLGLESTELPRSRRLGDLADEGENPNLPWAAGAIVSNARDIARFYSALLEGKLLERDSLEEMKQTVTAEPGLLDAGLGLFSTELECGRFWGHDGGILDYGTLVRAGEDGEPVAVVSVRGGAYTGPPPDPTPLLCPASTETTR